MDVYVCVIFQIAMHTALFRYYFFFSRGRVNFALQLKSQSLWKECAPQSNAVLSDFGFAKKLTIPIINGSLLFLQNGSQRRKDFVLHAYIGEHTHFYIQMADDGQHYTYRAADIF